MEEISEFEQEEMQAYFKLDRRIESIEKRKSELRESFYSQTMTTRTESNGLEIYSTGFNMEMNVVPYLDTILAREKTIEVLRKRKKYLNDYLNNLEPIEREYLIERYSYEHVYRKFKQADFNLYEEILEINEAINFMYDYPQEIRAVELDNDNLEDEFLQILEALEM